MKTNAWGDIAQFCWDEIPVHYPQIELDAFIIMPNHIHGIIVIEDRVDTVGAQYIAPLSKGGVTQTNVTSGSLGAIVRSFKAAVTRQVNRLPDAPEHPIWQRNYHEHIIRSEESLNYIRAYIAHNPAKWAEDSLFVS